MKKVDWVKTLANWCPSRGAEVVEDDARINQVVQFCDYAAKNFWDKIEFFGLSDKQEMESDNISKNDVFDLAAKQIGEHRKVWRTHIDQGGLTYEFPVTIEVGKDLKYVKFKIAEGVKGLASPRNVKKVFLRYHIAEQKIEVVYV